MTLPDETTTHALERERLLDALRREGLDAARLARADALVIESVALLSHEAGPHELRLGGSRFNGAPDAPVGWAPPEGEAIFVAQIDLAEVAPLDPAHRVPERGLLSFWLVLDEDGTAHAHVAWFADPSALVAGTAPERPVGMGFAPEVWPPPDRSNFWPLDPPYGLARQAWAQRRAAQRSRSSGLFQYDRPDERALATDEIVLLRVDTEDAYFGFDEAACLHFVIPRADLGTGSFARVRAVLGESM